MRRISFGKTDRGLIRDENQDSIFIDDDSGLAIVADGMGGHVAGKVAAEISTKSIAGFIIESQKNNDITWPFACVILNSIEKNRISNAIQIANKNIWNKTVEDTSLTGMGTTVCVVLSCNKNTKLVIGYVGDSRVYRIRKLVMEQLSEDHSLVVEQLKRNMISREEAAKSPHKNIVTRALGIEAHVTPDYHEDDILAGDIILSCSDGLTDYLSDNEIQFILSEFQNHLESAPGKLVTAANEKGGKDNISVIVTRFYE